MATKSSLQTQSDSWLIYVDLCSLIGRTCEDDLAPCTDFRFVQHSQHKHPLVRTNITISRHLKTAFIPTSARSFTMYHHVISVEVDILGPLQCLRPTRAAKRLCPSASSRVPSGAPLSPYLRARCLSTADTRTDTLQYIELINIRIAEFDK